MINKSFWNIVKEKWILNDDPIRTSKLPTAPDIGEIDDEFDMPDFSSMNSIDDINSALNGLADLGIEELPFKI